MIYIWRIVDREIARTHFSGDYLGEVYVDSMLDIDSSDDWFTVVEEAMEAGDLDDPGVYMCVKVIKDDPYHEPYGAIFIIDENKTFQSFEMPKQDPSAPRVTHWPPKS